MGSLGQMGRCADAKLKLGEGQEIDRPPQRGRNRPYSPGDGERVQLNPPPFLWLPSGADARYRLRICRDKAFAGPTLITFDDLEWCCEMLTRELSVGDWYWQYGVFKEGTETLWSKVRRFTVPESASPWVYPGRDSFQVPKERPHLFVTPSSLPELRRRAASGDLKEVADSLVRGVKKHAGEELVAEPEWLPKDKKKRGEQYTIYIRTTRRPMDRMERAGLAYLLTGDAECGAEAKRRILYFFSWDPHGPTNVFHNDEPAMWIMMRGCRAYDWTYDLFTPEERATVEASMRERAADFYKKMLKRPYENNPYESHAGRIIGFLGEAAIEFLPDWPEARIWLDYITKIYWGVYPAWGKEDGGWNEGPGYWSAYMTFGLHYVLALREGTGVDLSQRPFFQSTPLYKLYLSPPYSQMSPFGDGTQFKPSRPEELMYWFSTLTRSPEIRWYPEALGRGPGNGILGIVLKDDTLKPFPPYHLPQARHFDGVGLVCMHTDFGNGDNDVTFVMRSTPYGAVSHGHNDQNCFTLEAYGEALAIATGHYNRYGSPHHDKWTRQTKAKCGITYDGGKSQDRGWHAQGRIASFIHGEAFDLVVGDATKAYGGRLDRAVRDVVHVRPGIFVIRDDLASKEPRCFEYQLHALDKMAVDEAGATVKITRPKASLTTTFLLPNDLALTQTNQFDPPPTWPPDREYVNNWHATAALREPKSETQFLSVLMPAKTGQTEPLPTPALLTSDSAVGVELRYGNGARTIIVFAKPGSDGPVELNGLSTDGSCFAVALDAGGKPRGWMVREAKHLTMPNGARLVEAQSSATVTVSVAADGGRLDAVGDQGTVTVWWPDTPVAVTRDGKKQADAFREGRIAFTLSPDGNQLQVWNHEPVPEGEFSLALQFGGTKAPLPGRRYGRGRGIAAGPVSPPPGAYSLNPPKGLSVEVGYRAADGRIWLQGGELATVKGECMPDTLTFMSETIARVLPACARDVVPNGLSLEAEANWREEGGSIQVSNGGHRNASGNNNLWAWNTKEHSLIWDIEVDQPGSYDIWVIGSTEVGFLAEFTVNKKAGGAVLFQKTGGWARKNADEWRAFKLPGNGATGAFELEAGKQELALTNYTGVGFNVDQIILVKR